MNYEKLTVERFAQRLKEGAYKGLTGARRAIGKVGDWTKREKEKAHELADSHFAGGGKSSAPKAAPKKAAAPKAAPKKAATKAAPKKAAAAKKTAAAKPSAPPPAPKAAAAPKAPPQKRTPAVSVTPGAVVPPGPPILEEVTRQNSASAVIAAYRNSGELNPLEQRAYDVATAEYAENASKAAKRIVATAARGIPTPSPLVKTGEDEDAGALASAPVVTAPAGAPPRIPVPVVQTRDEDEPELTPEEQAQFDRLERGAGAVPAILGQ